jgi:hypothetical protein
MIYGNIYMYYFAINYIVFYFFNKYIKNLYFKKNKQLYK